MFGILVRVVSYLFELQLCLSFILLDRSEALEAILIKKQQGLSINFKATMKHLPHFLNRIFVFLYEVNKAWNQTSVLSRILSFKSFPQAFNSFTNHFYIFLLNSVQAF